jgi:hypothetical protein
MRLSAGGIASMLLVTAVANGCADSIGPESIVGLWDMTGSPPGNSQDMVLTLNGSTVSGRGSWCGEALGCGTTTVTGTATGNSIHLVTTFDSGLIETFDGRLISRNSLVGSVAMSMTPSEVFMSSQSFRRLTEDPIRAE